MTRRLLDLFCGAGGAAMGYSRAGFTDIVGVDNKPQKHYPFTFVLGDALEYMAEHGREFDVIHASPPCQAYAILNNIWKKAESYPDLVGPTRDLCISLGTPYIIENVPGAPMRHPAILCGEMFGLRVIRHRLFETRDFVMWPQHQPHTARASYFPSRSLSGEATTKQTRRENYIYSDT